MPPFFTFAGRILCMSHAPVQHVWAAHEGGDVPPFFHLRRFILRMPSPVQHVWAGLIGCVEAVFGRMRAEGPTCFSARGIAGYGVCFRVSDLQGQQKHKVCVSFALSERED